MAVYAAEPRFELPGQDFRGLFEEPLKAFRQSASDYPTVAIRMIDNYARLAVLLDSRQVPAGLLAFLQTCASDLHDEALARTGFAADREDIAGALARFEQRDPRLTE